MADDLHKPTVLVVEDDRDLSELIGLILEGAGYGVVTAANGREALAVVEARRPSVILLDMKMPIMNGWQFAREFRARGDGDTPIVVVTAAEDAQSRAEDIGADDWIGKPFDIQQLIRVVERHAQQHAG